MDMSGAGRIDDSTAVDPEVGPAAEWEVALMVLVVVSLAAEANRVEANLGGMDDRLVVPCFLES